MQSIARFRWLVVVCSLAMVVERALAQPLDTLTNERGARDAAVAVEAGRAAADPSDVLSAVEWRKVDAAVARALDWLAAQQEPDGSFPTRETGQPGITGL